MTSHLFKSGYTKTVNNFLNKKILISFLVFSFFTFLKFDFSFAQDTSTSENGQISSCPYTLTKNLKFGDNDEDVYVVQQILNSDNRTTIANSGVGSPGQETSYFGKGTREAVKRFQALFIEFVGTANGKVDDRTRKVMQSICDGDFEKKSDTSTSTASTTDTTADDPGPQITISSNVSSISAQDTFKVIVDASLEIQRIDPSSFIIDGATVRDVRKLSKTSYVATIVPNDDAKSISIQIEADSIKDKNGKTNSDASNEVTVDVKGAPVNKDASSTDNSSSIFDTLSNLLNSASSGTVPTVSCYGVQIPATSTCTSPLLNGDPNAQQQQQDPSAMMQMLSSLMKGMGGGGSGGGQQGGGQQGGGQQGGGQQGKGGQQGQGQQGKGQQPPAAQNKDGENGDIKNEITDCEAVLDKNKKVIFKKGEVGIYDMNPTGGGSPFTFLMRKADEDPAGTPGGSNKSYVTDKNKIAEEKDAKCCKKLDTSKTKCEPNEDKPFTGKVFKSTGTIKFVP